MISMFGEYRAPLRYLTLGTNLGIPGATAWRTRNSVAAAAAAGNSRTKPVRSYEISRCRKLLAFLGGTCNVAFH